MAEISSASTWLEDYEREGAACLPVRVSHAGVDQLRAACEVLFGSGGGFAKSEDAADKSAVIRDVLVLPWLIECLARLLGGSVVLEHSKAHRGSPAGGWHRDLGSYPMTSTNLATVAIWLDDVGPDHGGIVYISGSHRPTSRTALGEIPGKEGSQFRVSAGSVTAHHGLLFHRALPCTSEDRRRVILGVYRAASARPLNPRRTSSRLSGVLLLGAEPTTFSVEPDAIVDGRLELRSLWHRGQRCGMM